MQLEPVIGLEIHVQLKTQTKMFCGCAVKEDDSAPNTAICPVCLGFPGTLPAVNAKALEFAAMVGLALKGEVSSNSKFDRKNYFYPDLPKGYQISQFDLPVVSGGVLDATLWENGAPKKEVRVRITRAHLEEDAAKLLHTADKSASLVDYNRAGTPLIEIVTEPDLKTPEEARAFLQELRLVMRTIGVSDADMEKGQLRCDANISLRPVGSTELFPKTEIKNVNSFRSVERALDYEIKRQTKLWLDGKVPEGQSTRGWDDDKGATVEQRRKEAMSDYRYFPEPDLPPLSPATLIPKISGRMPELPDARRKRFIEEFGFSLYDATVFCDEPEVANYAEKVASELSQWLSEEAPTLSEGDKKKAIAKLVSGWLLTKLRGVMTEKNLTFASLKITPENMAELLTLIQTEKVTGPNALLILGEMAETGADPSDILEAKNLGRIDDSAELEMVARNILEANAKVVADYKGGAANAIQFLVGQMMKATRGKSAPDKAREMLERLMKE